MRCWLRRCSVLLPPQRGDHVARRHDGVGLQHPRLDPPRRREDPHQGLLHEVVRGGAVGHPCGDDAPHHGSERRQFGVLPLRRASAPPSPPPPRTGPRAAASRSRAPRRRSIAHGSRPIVRQLSAGKRVPRPNRVGRSNGRHSCRGWASRSATTQRTAGSWPMPRWLLRTATFSLRRPRLLPAGPPVDDAVPAGVDRRARDRQRPGERPGRCGRVAEDTGASAGRPHRAALGGSAAVANGDPSEITWRTWRGARRASRRA